MIIGLNLILHSYEQGTNMMITNDNFGFLCHKRLGHISQKIIDQAYFLWNSQPYDNNDFKVLYVSRKTNKEEEKKGLFELQGP